MGYEQVDAVDEIQDTNQIECPRRPARTPRRLEGGVMITENIGDRPFTSDLESFLRTELYYPTIDTALAELDRRFSTENIAVLKSVGAFIPGSDRFLDIDVLLPLAEQYKSNVDDFDKENKLLAFAVFIKQYRDAYYEVSRLIRRVYVGKFDSQGMFDTYLFYLLTGNTSNSIFRLEFPIDSKLF